MRRNDQLVEWCGPPDSTGNMVSDALATDGKVLTKPQNNGEYIVENQDDDDCDEISIVSSSDSQIECDSGGAVVLSDESEKPPCFQNIEVTNSSDVHFGNKTYYQGPVTIKQILYTNPQNGESDETQSDNKLPITDINRGDTANNVFVIPDTANGIVKNSNINNINCNNLSNNWTEKNKGKKWLQRRTSKQLIIGTAILILIMVAIITLIIALLTKYPQADHRHSQPSELESDVDKPNNDPEAIVNIIGRRSWVAEPPNKVAPMKLPVPKIIFVETRTESCSLPGLCVFVVRHLQTAHKEGSSKWDIKYNFLVGGDGNVYEGRGWNVTSSTITNCKENSLGIAFIGTFTHNSPPEKQIKAAKRLLNMGVSRKYIKPDYVLVYESQLLGKDEKSSNKLESILETWPHWLNENLFQNDTLKQEFCNS